jgi:hypothetical protein
LADGQVNEHLPNQLPTVTPQSELLRMLRKKIWLDPVTFYDAFVLRPGELGLSVCYDCTPDHCATITVLSPTYGAARLSTESVNALGLTVQADTVKANYAQFLGLPANEDNSDGAADTRELMAYKLAQVATIIDRTRRKTG